MAAGPLEGLKVIEVGVAMAGPFCAMTLADYGAEVIKIERMGAGDESRRWGPFFADGTSHYFVAANRNKRSLEIDLKHPEGIELFRRIAVDADIVIDNFRVGALDRLGIGYENLSKDNPRLIYCTISGFGTSGPRMHDRANDIFMQAFAGNMSVTGEEGRGPVKAGISVADVGGGMFGVIGILLALQARERSGRGQRVDTSLLEGQLAMLSYHLTYYFASGEAPVRRGAAMNLSPAYRAFEAADGWLVVGAFTDRMWNGVCRVAGRPQWIDDPRFATAAARNGHRDYLVGELNAVFADGKVDAWIAALAAEDVPATRVNGIDEIVADPQVAARDMVVELDHPNAGKIKMAGLPVKLSETPGSIRTTAPSLGEHSLAVAREAGLSAEAIAELVERGVIRSRVREASA